ncbi:hypothetical protein F5X68DRAFT_231009 [Plectosphaerella plurivora]|uniref:Uncharacterized protein n=1 Tax=Plectosphaerella plurivora TaxID=936078 RepID=A0A9P8VES1_9PEZI|nr:hypothetical protein F5X68DRAFT_231009 [Plectosphaerella plurivora]
MATEETTKSSETHPEITKIPFEVYHSLWRRLHVPDEEILDYFSFGHNGDSTRMGIFYHQDDDLSAAESWDQQMLAEHLETDAEYDNARDILSTMPIIEDGHIRLQLFVPAPYRPPMDHPNRRNYLQVLSCSRDKFESLIQESGLVTPKAFLGDILRGLHIIHNPTEGAAGPKSLEISTRFKLRKDMAMKVVFHPAIRTTKVLWLGIDLNSQTLDELIKALEDLDVSRTHPMAMVLAFVTIERNSIDSYIEKKLADAKAKLESATQDPQESNYKTLKDLVEPLSKTRHRLELWTNDVLTLIRFSNKMIRMGFWQSMARRVHDLRAGRSMLRRLTEDSAMIEIELEDIVMRAWQQKMGFLRVGREINEWVSKYERDHGIDSE